MKASLLLFLAGTASVWAQEATEDAQPTSPVESVEVPVGEELPPVQTEPSAQEVNRIPTESVTEPPKNEMLAGYKKGFFLQSADGDFSMKLKGRIQARFEFDSVDGGTEREENYAISIPRARIKLAGNLYGSELDYSLQLDMGKGQVSLKDALLNYKVGEKVWVRVGQFKKPFSRQQISSSGKQTFVDRAITDKGFGSGRDIGVMLHNRFEKSPTVEWAVGVFNGTGDKGQFSGDVEVDTMTGEGEVTSGKFSNVPDKMAPMVVARVGYNSGKMKGYSEADLEGGPLRFGLGASVLSEFDSDNDDSSMVAGQLDYIVKNNGFSSTGGIYIATGQDGAKFSDQALAAIGAHAQFGYVLSGNVQPAVRYELVAPDGPDNNVHAVRGAVSLYKEKHNFKWTTDIGVLINETPGDSTMDLQGRTQLQINW